MESAEKSQVQCYNCINPAVCVLPGHLDADGHQRAWCQECSFCSRCKECAIQYYVYWDVGCETNPITLCTDVCAKCEPETPNKADCNCASTARNKKIMTYTWIQTTNKSNLDQNAE